MQNGRAEAEQGDRRYTAQKGNDQGLSEESGFEVARYERKNSTGTTAGEAGDARVSP
ncbi:MAG: hypothetical protein WCJ02_03650 [bacterium]